jgi:plasmid stabilization system protein ParE
VDFHHEAGLEFEAAFEWYMDRNPDAAVRFDLEVDRALAQILVAPRRWAAGPHGTRRFLLRQFPYVLIYREHAGSKEVQILAVAHTSRRPGYWKARLS